MTTAAAPQAHPSRPPSRRLVSYTLALVLPVLCSVLAVRVPALYAFPVALHFLVMIMVATLGGLGPALLTVAISILARLVQAALFPHPPLTPTADIFRFVILLAGALIISLLSRRRRISEARLEVALHDLQDRTANLIDSLASNKCACWTLDLDSGRAAQWFSGSFPVFGRPFAELETMSSLASLLHPDDQPRLSLLTQQMRSTSDPIVFEFRCPWPNGDIHHLEMRANRVSGPRCLWRGVTLDITERTLAEAALLRSEKLAAMGRLASTVAHEINNPLEAVTNLLYLARTSPQIDSEADAYLASAERELARLSNITRLTLGFVRTTARVAQTDIAATLDEVLSILEHRLNAWNVRVDRHYHPGFIVSIAPHELRQIVTNLLANAVDAVSHPNAHIRIAVVLEAGNIIISVSDNGSGIDSANLTRIFDPFFSTKEEVGTGIGLWVTRELVEKNAGRISVESRPPTTDASADLFPSDFTTTFRIDFPAALAPTSASALRLTKPLCIPSRPVVSSPYRLRSRSEPYKTSFQGPHADLPDLHVLRRSLRRPHPPARRVRSRRPRPAASG